MRTLVAFDSTAVARYPTTDGRSISFGDEIVIGSFDLRFDSRSATDEMPTDVVACDFRLSDAEGRVWQTTSRCTTEVFVRYMHDFSSAEGDCFFRDRAPASFVEALSSRRVLDDARFSSDDRFYRTLVVSGETIQTMFYYTTLRFDVGITPDEDEHYPLLTKLAVRVRKDCLVRMDSDAGDAKAIGDIGFFMDWRYLLRSNTAAYFRGYDRWHDVAIPMPLVFTATNDTDNPQPSVVVV